MITKRRTTKVIIKISGVLVVGDSDLIQKCTGALSLNYDGNVEVSLRKIPSHLSWYKPIGGGRFPLYGHNASGKVICGMVFLKKGETDTNGVVYDKDVIFVKPAEYISSWGF